MARRKRNYTSLLSIIALILGLIIGFIGSIFVKLPDSYVIPSKVASTSTGSVTAGEINADVVKSNDLSIHFLELGNKYTGDCTFIKVGTTEILIDAGSKASSIPYIKSYIDKYIEGKLDFVIVTHAHEDHYAGFATNSATESLFDIYEVGTIIEFAKTNKTTSNKMYANYVRERNEEVSNGAKFYTALDCINENNGAEREYNLGNNTSMQILYQKYYEETASTENDYSVCLQIINADKKYLFTGDLEEDGEESLVHENVSGGKNANMLGVVELYKAGHHGSKTSSSNALLEVIQPKNVCVCCCAGSSEYTSKNENQFPTQAFVDRVSIYTSNIYVTTLCLDYKANSFESFNGTIVYTFDSDSTNDKQKWYFSNNSTKLKDTEWFKANRTLPTGAVA